jgi:hypothetical protein
MLRWRIFRPEDSSLGLFFARSILRRIILRSKKYPGGGKFFVRVILRAYHSPESFSPESSSLKLFLEERKIIFAPEKNYPAKKFSVPCF